MIDFSAFERPLSRKDIKKYNGKLPGLPKIAGPLVSYIFISLFLVIIVSPIIFILLAGNLPYRIQASIGLFALAHILAFKWSRNSRSNLIRSALFAKENGYSYSTTGGKFTELKGLGSLLGEPNQSNVIKGSLQGYDFQLCGIYTHKLFKTDNVGQASE